MSRASADYYFCGLCNKENRYTHTPKSAEMVRIIDRYAAGGYRVYHETSDT